MSATCRPRYRVTRGYRRPPHREEGWDARADYEEWLEAREHWREVYADIEFDRRREEHEAKGQSQ